MKASVLSGELIVMDEHGDTRLTWDREVPEEVDAAKMLWTKMKSKGYVGFMVDRRGEKGRVLDDFDPEAEKIILAPQLRGG